MPSAMLQTLLCACLAACRLAPPMARRRRKRRSSSSQCQAASSGWLVSSMRETLPRVVVRPCTPAWGLGLGLGLCPYFSFAQLSCVSDILQEEVPGLCTVGMGIYLLVLHSKVWRVHKACMCMQGKPALSPAPGQGPWPSPHTYVPYQQ